MFYKNLRKGQTLVELMVAIGLIAMVVTALLVLVSAATKIGISSLKRTQASKIAVLGLESVRYFRDKDSYYSIPAGEVCYTIPDEVDPGGQPLAQVSCTPEALSFRPVTLDGNAFGRQIKIMPEDDVTHSRDVIVRVRWQESTGERDTSTIYGINYRYVVLSTSIAEW